MKQVAVVDEQGRLAVEGVPHPRPPVGDGVEDDVEPEDDGRDEEIAA